MSERERAHASQHAQLPSPDSDLAPGRSRSTDLVAPTHPIASGLIRRKLRDANGVADSAEQAVATAASSSGQSLPEPKSSTLRVPTAPVASGLVQRKADHDGVHSDAADHVDAAASSTGQPLPEDLRGRFESSLGADLGGVRVHTGSASATAAGALGARAYAMGSNVHFAAGQYNPSSHDGQLLLAHEVAHTVQQGSTPQIQHKLEVSSAGDHLEVEADRAAQAMVAGSSFSVSMGSGIQRKVFRKEPTRTRGAR